MLMKELHHKSVMIEEVLSILQPSDGKIYIDGTLGAGGHSKRILESARCKVIGIDKDPEAISLCNDIKKRYQNEFFPIEENFSELKNCALSLGYDHVDGILLDLGVSSMQLNSSERGFSFKYNAPLDMRMNKSGDKAYNLINSAKEDLLADIIFKYGEERLSRKIAKEIVKQREIKNIETTFDLSEILTRVCKGNKRKIHPATKTFQAIRIYLNNELKELYDALLSSEEILSEGGKLIVISFHSLEDRIVKNFIRDNSISMKKYNSLNSEKSFVYESRRVIRPSKEEINENKRSRSAKLRWVYRSSLPFNSIVNLHDYQKYGGLIC